MPRKSATSPVPPDSAGPPPVETILGYLNFSTGRPDPAVQAACNALFAATKPQHWSDFQRTLVGELDRLAAEKPAFRNVDQARAVLGIVYDELLPAYLRHHADLLFHLTANDLLNPFFFARLCEATLAAGGPWDERERITAAALATLNDYVGHRPIAVLENGQKSDIYTHERFRPVPLFLAGAGVAVGPYHDLIAAALEQLAATPADLRRQSDFHLDHLDEIAVDVRAHDALHPAYKRTNYLFGEWDPHTIDNAGFYRRFVLRKAILDALLGWMAAETDLPPAERLHDAGVVLCGTILMASAISGDGPTAHDSTASLTSLLPVVARQRDAYYDRVMRSLSGTRQARLAAVEEGTRQPFGHVRQRLNISLAGAAAAQMQRRTVAEQFARMGFADAARAEAARIPAVSTRFECELNVRAEGATRLASRGETTAAADQLAQATDLLLRGVACGGLIDPWNVLGFQAQFPLFVAREDSVPDHRAEWLILYMDRLFASGARVLTEAAAAGDTRAAARVKGWFEQTASWWDRYATAVVSDLPGVKGSELAASAAAVAETISEWRASGRATGDIAFWRERVGRLETPRAFGDVVEAVLNRGDFVAASGLLFSWLGEAETVGLGDGHGSFYDLATRWLRDLTTGPAAPPPHEQARLGKRFFDFLEANAGEFWSIPTFGDPLLETSSSETQPNLELTAPGGGDDDDNIFGAAYEGMVFRDSTDDGVEGETLDGPARPDGGEFEDRLRVLEPRLRFLDLIARLWRLAAGRVRPAVALPAQQSDDTFAAAARLWQPQAVRFLEGLRKLIRTIEKTPLGAAGGDLEANVEYDAQLQSKNHLLHVAVATAVRMTSAERLLRARAAVGTPPPVQRSKGIDATTAVLAPLLEGDAAGVRRHLPALLKELLTQPLLYVAPEHGGDPLKAIAARGTQELLNLLATELPRLGLLREVRQVPRLAFRMERRSRPGGLAVTEFDRLFRTTLKTVLDAAVLAEDEPFRPRPSDPRLRRLPRVVRAETFGPPNRRPRPLGSYRPQREARADRETVHLVGLVVDRYMELWLRHSSTMRLSAAESLSDSATWNQVKAFIHRYGGELFHARVLPLSNLRAILHGGLEQFFDYLSKTDDPLRPSPLVAALESDRGFRADAAKLLELIYATVVDEIERFVEYNSTTTQSDYGERFDSFLDFLRAEAAYRRDEWNMIPLRIAHEVLATAGRTGAERLWADMIRSRTAAAASKHLARLATLEKRHAMRLPSISDHLGEKFVKPLAVDRILALVPQAVRDAHAGRADSPAFRALRQEIDTYLLTTSGSPAELPEWLHQLDAAVSKALDPRADTDRESVTGRPIPTLPRGRVLRQLSRRPQKDEA